MQPSGWIFWFPRFLAAQDILPTQYVNIWHPGNEAPEPVHSYFYFGKEVDSVLLLPTESFAPSAPSLPTTTSLVLVALAQMPIQMQPLS